MNKRIKFNKSKKTNKTNNKSKHNNYVLNFNNNQKSEQKTINFPKTERDRKKSKKTKKSLNFINQKTINKVKKIMEYTNDELNNLSYELALQYDTRSYFKYYLSLLKTKHDFIFSFFTNNDYNSKIIKIDIFFIGFSINYTVNALFSTMIQCIIYIYKMVHLI